MRENYEENMYSQSREYMNPLAVSQTFWQFMDVFNDDMKHNDFFCGICGIVDLIMKIRSHFVINYSRKTDNGKGFTYILL